MENMQTDSQLLKNIRQEKRLSQPQLAEILGCSKQYISQVESGRTTLSKKYFDILNSKFELSSNIQNVDDCITIEHIGIKPECDSGISIYDEPEIRPIRISADTITRYMRCSHPSNLKAFTACGDSMRPLIDDGDTVLVDIGRTDIVNQGVFVFTSNNEWRIKRLNLKLNGTLEVISDNPTYEKEYLTPDDNIDIVIRGRVVLNLSRSL